MQGAGWLTSEELVWDAEGRLLTHSPDTYKIPAIGDTPDVFNVAFLSEATQSNVIHGSKAVGEPPLMLAISVREAIRDAVAAFGKSAAKSRSLRRPHARRSSTQSRPHRVHHDRLKQRRNMRRRSRFYSEENCSTNSASRAAKSRRSCSSRTRSSSTSSAAKFIEANVAVDDGRVIGFGDYEAREVIDLEGAYLAPSLIDGHFHVESTMVTIRSSRARWFRTGPARW